MQYATCVYRNILLRKLCHGHTDLNMLIISMDEFFKQFTV